jgi:hypothetical protein
LNHGTEVVVLTFEAMERLSRPLIAIAAIHGVVLCFAILQTIRLVWG